MIISLERKIFQVHPAIRFSKERCVNESFLMEMYRRYVNLGYSSSDLSDFYNIKTKKVMNKKSAWLWIGRLEAYNMAQIAIKRGAKEVNIEYFGRLKNLVIRDIKEDINKHNYRN